MGRPMLANRCGDPHQEEVGGQVRDYTCQRALGHAGQHSSGGSVHWDRRIERPAAGSSGAASPMR